MSVQYTLVGAEDGSSNISVFVTGHAPQVAHSSHPNFDAILEAVFLNDASVVDLFDVARTAATRFERLTERVTVANGIIYLDGEPIHNSLTSQVLRFMDEGVDDWMPLVLFFEAVQNNPNEHSREQLFTWLNDRDFTITRSGMIVGYKGVMSDGKGGFQSVHAGRAIVNGVVHSGHIPNPLGAIVEMPRSEVTFDPSLGCHSGLHVGTYDYAVSYSSGGALLEVHVNPRDVVSVPTDSNHQKMRVCRYRVVDTLSAPYSSAVVDDRYDYDDDDYGWGDDEGYDLY